MYQLRHSINENSLIQIILQMIIASMELLLRIVIKLMY